MDFKFLIKPIVFEDIDDIVEYYEEKSIGLGNRFYSQVLLSLDEIKLQPFTYSFAKFPIRRHTTSNFPYKIFYTISDDFIIVLAVTHAKRSNKFLKKRLKLFL